MRRGGEDLPPRAGRAGEPGARAPQPGGSSRRPAGGPGEERRRRRVAVLRAHGAEDVQVDELLAYAGALVDGAAAPPPPAVELPLADEPCVADWRSYARRSEEIGVLACLREVMVQLHFPVRAGTSAAPAYLDATRRGRLPAAGGGGLELAEPDGLRLFLHPTPAGRIGVVVAAAREDFVALVRALTCRNEPEPVPDSVGACIVGGYNNWRRVRRLERRWRAGEIGAGRPFAHLLDQKELYQDRFILLSTGPYSGVPAGELGLADARWRELSLSLRLEHECAHYFTRRVLGSMKNTLHDEILADHAGLLAAVGGFRADWFLRFLGLEEPPRVRPGGRLLSYRGDPPLSDGALAVLTRLVASAARNLEAAETSRPPGDDSLGARGRRLLALGRLSLEEMADPGGKERLQRAVSGRPERRGGCGTA